MSEVTETPVIEQSVETPEQRYEYQPTDEVGRPLGGRQVIKYRTQDELVQKITERAVLLQRELREQKKKLQLGIDDEDIPADAPRFDEAVEFVPRQLSSEEKLKLSRDLLDPEKFDEASATLFEASVGAKPEKICATLTGLQKSNQRLQIESEVRAFESSVPDYFKCRENGDMIASWLNKRSLAPVRENFLRAYEALKKQNVLIQTAAPVNEPVVPAVTEPVVPAQAATPAAAAPTPEVVVEPVTIPTGITRNMSSGEGQPKSLGDEIVYDAPIYGTVGKERKIIGTKRYTGLKAIDVMPSEEFKRRLRTDKDFEKIYDRLMSQAGQANSRDARPV